MDPPQTARDFADNFNSSAISYLDNVLDYQEILHEVEEANVLGEGLINLVRTLVAQI